MTIADYSSVLSLIKSEKFSLVYVAIGCAQGHYQYGIHSPQQMPPCIANWRGRKLCLLIDPYLEPVPYLYRDIGVPSGSGDTVTVGHTTVVCMRNEFHWPSRFTEPMVARPHCELMDQLCATACADGGPHVIVQDYCGNDIRLYYPVSRFPDVLRKKVLFDFTYRDSGCFVDFSKVRLLLDSAGDFIQPAYSKLATIVDAGLETEARVFEVNRRCSTMSYAVLPLYLIQIGLKEPREWCTAERVLTEATYIFGIYGITPSADTGTLKRLLSEFFFDIARAAEIYSSEEEEVDIMIDNGGEGYKNAIDMMKALVI